MIQGANNDRARQKFPGEQHDVPDGILGTLAAQPSSVDDAIQDFTDHLKKSPAERMVDAWMAQHGVSREEFDAMSTTEKQKLLDEMKRDFEAKMKEKVDGRPERAGTDIVV